MSPLCLRDAADAERFTVGPTITVPVEAAIPGAGKWPKLKRLRSAKVTKVDYKNGTMVVSVEIDGDKEAPR